MVSLDKSERGWKGVVAVVLALQQHTRLKTVVHFLLFLGNCHWISMSWFPAPFTVDFSVYL